jgi:electron transfer flavoprotein alpha subunit
MREAKNVGVYLEPGEGRAVQINKGLLTEGKRIAELLGGALFAIEIGNDAAGACSAGEHGVRTVYRITGDRLSEIGSESTAWALSSALKHIPFRILLFADTAMGTDLAPRVASALGTATVLGAADIRVVDGEVSYAHPLYGGQLAQEIAYRVNSPEIATVQTGGLYDRPCSPVITETIEIPVTLPIDLAQTSSGSPVPPDPETVDILYAKRILGIGAGCVDSIPFAEELAQLLNASIATTRPVVDDGYIPKGRMIGQTGKIVTPDLYLALGVSGSPHHVAGIQQSKTVLSINVDPRAPIFGFSDTGFVADLKNLLPRLIERIKCYRDGDVQNLPDNGDANEKS